MKGGVCFDYKTKYTKNRNGIDMSYHGNWYFKRMQWKNNHQESHTESNNSAQEELHSNVSAQENQNESSTESKTEETSQNKEMYLPNTSPLTMTFSSGAGAWATSITLNRDGSFEGSYHDSDMGFIGEGYPHGTVYICKFSGVFDNIQQIDDNTYAMTLKEITTESTESKEWITDGVRYIASEPYGLESGKEFLFYTPQTSVKKSNGRVYRLGIWQCWS